jgi:hypothetical protein
MEPDIHWSAMAGHVSTFIVNGGRYDHIFFTERFDEGMQGGARRGRDAGAGGPRRGAPLQRERGARAEAAHPVEAYFDDLAMHLMKEIYHRDFELFRYDFDNPGTRCRWARSTSTRCTRSSGSEGGR